MNLTIEEVQERLSISKEVFNYLRKNDKYFPAPIVCTFKNFRGVAVHKHFYDSNAIWEYLKLKRGFSEGATNSIPADIMQNRYKAIHIREILKSVGKRSDYLSREQFKKLNKELKAIEKSCIYP